MMPIIKLWTYDGHRKMLLKALRQTRAIHSNGMLDHEYTIALYLLTGLENAWPRLKRYVTMDGINCKAMWRGGALSRGEKLIVGLAGNLFSGDASFQCTPLDLIGLLDDDLWELAMNALTFRRSTLMLDVLDLENS